MGSLRQPICLSPGDVKPSSVVAKGPDFVVPDSWAGALLSYHLLVVRAGQCREQSTLLVTTELREESCILRDLGNRTSGIVILTYHFTSG